jgi:hypothetical protein
MYAYSKYCNFGTSGQTEYENIPHDAVKHVWVDFVQNNGLIRPQAGLVEIPRKRARKNVAGAGENGLVAFEGLQQEPSLSVFLLWSSDFTFAYLSESILIGANLKAAVMQQSGLVQTQQIIGQDAGRPNNLKVLGRSCASS